MANELLTGLLGQPKGPQAPGTTQNSYGGTVPSPVAQPPQTPGFQNNTANPQWWGGAGGGTAPMGATSGYGSSTPTPYTPPSDDTGTDTGEEAAAAAATPPAGPVIDQAAVNKKSQEIRAKTDEINRQYKKVQQHQRNYVNWMASAQSAGNNPTPKPGQINWVTTYQNNAAREKLLAAQAQQDMARMQQALQRLQQELSQLQTGA